MSFNKTGIIELDTAYLNYEPKKGCTTVKLITVQKVKEAIEKCCVDGCDKFELLHELGLDK